MSRLWSRLRRLQSEYRDVTSVEVRHDLALEFSRGAKEYLDAATRSRRDPLKDIAGIAEILEINIATPVSATPASTNDGLADLEDVQWGDAFG